MGNSELPFWYRLPRDRYPVCKFLLRPAAPFSELLQFFGEVHEFLLSRIFYCTCILHESKIPVNISELAICQPELTLHICPVAAGKIKNFFILHSSILSAFWLKYPYIECWFSSRKFLKKYCENPCNTRICVVSLSGMIVGSGVSMPETQSADMRWCRRWPSFETGNFCGVCPILKPGETGLTAARGAFPSHLRLRQQ